MNLKWSKERKHAQSLDVSPNYNSQPKTNCSANSKMDFVFRCVCCHCSNNKLIRTNRVHTHSHTRPWTKFPKNIRETNWLYHRTLDPSFFFFFLLQQSSVSCCLLILNNCVLCYTRFFRECSNIINLLFHFTCVCSIDTATIRNQRLWEWTEYITNRTTIQEMKKKHVTKLQKARNLNEPELKRGKHWTMNYNCLFTCVLRRKARATVNTVLLPYKTTRYVIPNNGIRTNNAFDAFRYWRVSTVFAERNFVISTWNTTDGFFLDLFSISLCCTQERIAAEVQSFVGIGLSLQQRFEKLLCNYLHNRINFF